MNGDREKKQPQFHATIRGRAGRDAVRKFSAAGKEYARVSLAVDARKAARDAPTDQKPQALWITVIGSRSESVLDAIGSIRKGNPVTVTGALWLEPWTDRNGNAREDWTMFVDTDSTPVVAGQRRDEGHDERREQRQGMSAGERTAFAGGGGGGDDADDSDIPFAFPLNFYDVVV